MTFPAAECPGGALGGMLLNEVCVKSRLSIVAVVASILSSVCVASPSVVSHGEVALTRDDVIRAVDTYVPEGARAELLTNEQKLRDFVAQLFAIRMLAQDVEKRGPTADEQWKIHSAAERAAAQIQLDHVVASGEKPNFERAALEAYKANPESFTQPEQIRVEHILVKQEGRSKAEALVRAREVLELVKADKKKFGEIAKEYSEDPTVKRNSGDLGFFGRGQMVKEFEDAAFAMERLGDIAGPVESRFGYHVIRFIERKPAEVAPFEKVREKLVADEALKYKRARVTQEYERIGKLPGITVDQEAIKSLLKLDGQAVGRAN